MTNRRTRADVLNRDFLEIRARVLELAAALDRLDGASRAEHETPDGRIAQLRQSIEALLDPGPGRAETVQRIFSLEYDPNWRAKFELADARSGA